MIILKALGLVLCSALIGFFVWGIYSVVIWVLLNSFSIGFLKGSTDFADVIRPAFIVGAIHGTVIGIGVSLIAHRGELDTSFFYGFVAAEIVLFLAQLSYSFTQFSEWTRPGYAEYLIAVGTFFLLFSIVCLLPTIVISLVTSLTARSLYT